MHLHRFRYRDGICLRLELLERLCLLELPGDLRELATASIVHAESKLRRTRMRGLRNSRWLRRDLLLYPDGTGSLGLRQSAPRRLLVRRPMLLRVRHLSARRARGRGVLGHVREHELHVPVS